MKHRLLAVSAALAFSVAALAQTSLNFVNQGNYDYATNPPIDARNFLNLGTFSGFTTDPFDTQNTLTFTNKGTITGGVGFQFDLAASVGVRLPAASFYNGIGASVIAQDVNVPTLVLGGRGSQPISFLTISATNIVNQGTFGAGAGGVMHLEGQNLDFTRGGLQIQPLQPNGSINLTNGFIPDIAIYDNYWASSNQNMNSSTILKVAGSNVTVISPIHNVFTAFGRGRTQLGFLNPAVFIYTNAVTPTNWIVQAVFVGINDTNISARAKFFPSTQPTNAFRTATVALNLALTNVVTGLPFTTSLYLEDTIASETNLDLLPNFNGGGFRPASYLLERVPPTEYTLGSGGNGVIASNLLYDTSFSNVFVTNIYAAYSATVDSLVSQVSTLPGASLTNLPGRIEVVAASLDLTKTRIRGEGLVSIRATHINTDATNGVSGAVLDTQNVSFDLGSTNGLLSFKNLGHESVMRLGGQLNAWSGVWTNDTSSYTTNTTIGPDPNNTNNMVTNSVITTNTIEIGFHVFMVDAQGLSSSVPVNTANLTTRGANILVGDNMIVSESLLVDGDAFTLNGRLSLTGDLDSWSAATAPTVKYFTNAGVLNIPSTANFGGDRSQPYVNFVNSGTNNAAAFVISCNYLENSGLLNSAGPVTITAGSGNLVGGTSVAGGDTQISAAALRLRAYTLSANGGLYLNVSESLSDAGGGSSNTLSCQLGFTLPVKPKIGDLLGTSLQVGAPQGAAIVNLWAGEDRGASPAGFTNNVAIGKLIIGAGLDSLVTFTGAGTKNAIYVDYLQLGQTIQNDLATYLAVDPNMTIYFADANVAVDQLDGQLGGRLRWVNFAGPNSSVDVALPNNRTIRVNRNFRYSPSIDSDGDGIANAFDLSPFDGVKLLPTLTATNVPPQSVLLSWQGAAGTVYTVQFATDLGTQNWQDLLTFTNNAANNGVVTVPVPMPVAGAQRYYRVGYNPQ